MDQENTEPRAGARGSEREFAHNKHSAPLWQDYEALSDNLAKPLTDAEIDAFLTREESGARDPGEPDETPGPTPEAQVEQALARDAAEEARADAKAAKIQRAIAGDPVALAEIAGFIVSAFTAQYDDLTRPWDVHRRKVTRAIIEQRTLSALKESGRVPGPGSFEEIRRAVEIELAAERAEIQQEGRQLAARRAYAGDDQDADVPVQFDVAAFLDGTEPEKPKPTLFRRSDGEFLFYGAAVNMLFGDPDSGKTWVALHALAQALQDGLSAAFIDLDHNGMAAILSRLTLLGVPTDALANPDIFWYAEPQDAEHMEEIVTGLHRWEPSIVVIDSVGELLPMLGLSSMRDDDYTLAHRRIFTPLVRSGAGVVLVDHLAKNADSRAFGASGAVAKKRAVDGLSLRITPARKFTPGQGGKSLLTVHKDRHGSVKANCPVEDSPLAGEFMMSTGPTPVCEVRAPGAAAATTPAARAEADAEAAASLFEVSSRVVEVVHQLNDLGVPTAAGRDRARKALADAGIPVSTDDLRLALQLRKST